MKAVISNTFNIGDLSLTTRTVLFARKREGRWRVHLNYHKFTAKWLTYDENSYVPLIYGISVQTSRDSDWVAVIASILGLAGIAVSVVNLVKQIVETLADVSSLLPKVLEWIQTEFTRIVEGQEPTYRTALQTTEFVLNLFKNGQMLERRSPRWRIKEQF